MDRWQCGAHREGGTLYGAWSMGFEDGAWNILKMLVGPIYTEKEKNPRAQRAWLGPDNAVWKIFTKEMAWPQVTFAGRKFQRGRKGIKQKILQTNHIY